MSGIARVLHERGTRVTGSDMKASGYTNALVDLGVPVTIGHRAENLGDPEVVVVSTAIPKSNPELMEAERRGLPIWPRARMLAEAAGPLKTVAVAGTHGKTTTSSMVTAALRGAGVDPTFLIGGELNDVGSNAGCGEGDLYVVEADESDGSFLHLEPHAALVTNIEADHLDHYENVREIEETFAEFMAGVPADGILVVWADDPRLPRMATECPARVITYGCADGADVRCSAVVSDGSNSFSVRLPDGSEHQVCLSIPGEHNALNATGALAMAWALGHDAGRGAGGLSAFRGVRRRFEVLDEVGGVTVVDDYAHHPTEVRATLRAAREAGFARVWTVFQPHRYSRTASLGREFGGSFEEADRVVLMDVYSAGETPIPGISGKTLVEAILDERPRSQVAYFPHRTDVEAYVVPRLRAGDVVLTMGAGDVTNVGTDLVRALHDRDGAAEVSR